ncbi:MAG: S8 family serine peptidase [bacterium]|nr:S8 family serine peptidase [bacterium]
MKQPGTKFFALLLTICLLLAACLFSRPTDDNLIHLKSRKFVAEEGIEEELRTRMQECTSSHLHAFIKLKTYPHLTYRTRQLKNKPQTTTPTPITKGMVPLQEREKTEPFHGAKGMVAREDKKETVLMNGSEPAVRRKDTNEAVQMNDAKGMVPLKDAGNAELQHGAKGMVALKDGKDTVLRDGAKGMVPLQRAGGTLAGTGQSDIHMQLKPFGIELLFHIQSGLWVGSIPKDTNLNDERLQSLVQWMGAIRPEDKISSDLRRGNIHDWAREKDNRIRVSVAFFKYVTQQEAEDILRRVTNDISRWDSLNGYDTLMPREAVEELAREDAVKWLQQGPLPFMPLNNNTRRALKVDTLQECDTTPLIAQYQGLTGSGVQAGIWDSGIDPAHDDFKNHNSTGTATTSRVLLASHTGNNHGTLVAGVLGGNGFRGTACATGTYLFRGMAPEVQFVSNFPHIRWGAADITFLTAIGTHGMDISNHSYVQSRNGRYLGTAARMDGLIRGDASSSNKPIPPRPMVWAAGNNGITSQYSSVAGYFSVEAPSKNAIVVGGTSANLASHTNRLLEMSSLGPTLDGRIKPDLVAPGGSVKSTNLSTNCYAGASGTSLSAPAVTGVACLMLQQYADTYDVNLDTAAPLPSTVKAVLIHSATDLVHTTADEIDPNNPDTGKPVLYHRGPDYATGYGLVNAPAAVAVIKEKNIIEDSIATRKEVDEYTCEVPPGTDRIQFTLAWDDEPDTDTYGAETLPRLVNDLDLVAVAPNAQSHYPWILAALTPAATAGDPDPITTGDITAATRGEDHLNNVEMVTVDSPMAGTWKIRVDLHSGSTGTLSSGQKYSLVGNFHQDMYFCDMNANPGAVYGIKGGAPEAIYTAASARVYHSAFSPNGTLYVSNSNKKTIERVDPSEQGTKVIYTHTTYSRDIAFDNQGLFYFSQATGAGGDGMIYHLDMTRNVVSLFYKVKLSEVDGSWAGDFCFDSNGVLYLSSGNRVGGSVYKVTNPASASAPVKEYTIPTDAVSGIAFNRSGQFFYTNWGNGRGNIFRLTLSDGKRKLVHSFPGKYIWDVSFR